MTDLAAHPFVAAFAEAWAQPTPDRLVALLATDVRLVAPLTPTTVGAEAARRQFARLLDLVPDLTGDVRRSSASGDLIFIEFTLSATLGGKRFAWDVVDRFLIEGGVGKERISYFDPLPLIGAIARRPTVALRFLRARLGR